MTFCISKTINGHPCRSQAIKGSKYCFIHDPASGAARALARRQGGKRRRVSHIGDASKIPPKVRTIENVLAVLDYALVEAIPLENSIQRGRLLVAICSGFLEAIKIGELETRLLAIESALKMRQ